MTNEPKFVEQDSLRKATAESENVVVIDVRSPEEYATGHVPGSVNIPVAELDSRLSELPDGAEVVTVCTLGGARSCGAAEHLSQKGYRASALRGGFGGWKAKD